MKAKTKEKQIKKHVPIRTCIVTRKKISKFDLIRLVRVGDENVEVDLKGKGRGRGANLTPDIAIFDEAIKRGVIEKALKLKKKMGPEKIKDLREQFSRAIEEKEFRPKNKPVRIRIDKRELEKVV